MRKKILLLTLAQLKAINLIIVQVSLGCNQGQHLPLQLRISTSFVSSTRNLGRLINSCPRISRKLNLACKDGRFTLRMIRRFHHPHKLLKSVILLVLNSRIGPKPLQTRSVLTTSNLLPSRKHSTTFS